MALEAQATEITGQLTLFLCGDVMLGRGIDQILARPGDPELREPSVVDARRYVDLAEAVNGDIPRPVDDAWPWGDALAVLDDERADVRVINLETSITRSAEFAAGKSVHYRMSPDNAGSVAVARPDVCVLANNHVMDFGVTGLAETLDVLDDAGVRVAGAGRELAGAQRPAVVDVGGGRRVVVVGIGTESSGVPAHWAAGAGRPGVCMLDTSLAGADAVAELVRAVKRPGDVVVVSIHWGSNWGYGVPREHTVFAHRLIDDAWVDVVHGHSSHHPRPIEVYRGKLILYGCGDFVNDYEGIPGYEQYRDDLRPMYFADIDVETGALRDLRIVVMQARRMRVERAADADAEWLASALSKVSGGLELRPEAGALRLHA